jgi:DNA-directed RNA polymerase specialized sigma24 family protein
VKAKEFLQQIRKLDKLIENKLIERQHWKNIACSITGNQTSENVQSTKTPDKMAAAVGKYVDIEREIDGCIDVLYETKKDILNVIEQLETTEYDILHKVYVQYMDLNDVAIKLDRSYTSVTSTHGRALKNVQKILDERYKNILAEQIHNELQLL